MADRALLEWVADFPREAAEEIERSRAALRVALPILEDIAAGGRRLTPISRCKKARELVSRALGGHQQRTKDSTKP